MKITKLCFDIISNILKSFILFLNQVVYLKVNINWDNFEPLGILDISNSIDNIEYLDYVQEYNMTNVYWQEKQKETVSCSSCPYII